MTPRRQPHAPWQPDPLVPNEESTDTGRRLFARIRPPDSVHAVAVMAGWKGWTLPARRIHDLSLAGVAVEVTQPELSRLRVDEPVMVRMELGDDLMLVRGRVRHVTGRGWWLWRKWHVGIVFERHETSRVSWSRLRSFLLDMQAVAEVVG